MRHGHRKGARGFDSSDDEPNEEDRRGLHHRSLQKPNQSLDAPLASDPTQQDRGPSLTLSDQLSQALADIQAHIAHAIQTEAPQEENGASADHHDDIELSRMNDEEFECHVSALQTAFDEELRELEAAVGKRRQHLELQELAWQEFLATSSTSSSVADGEVLARELEMLEREQAETRMLLRDQKRAFDKQRARQKFEEDHLVEEINALRTRMQSA